MFIVVLTAACAQQSAAPVQAAGPVAPVTGDLARFEGWYQGQRFPVGSAFTCRETARNIWFRVENGLIEMRRSRHRRSAVGTSLMTGTLSPAGEVVMQGTDTDRMAAGRIEGDRLTAGDISAPAVVREGHSSCTYRYEAVRREGLRN
jgi:hypothetical protein